MHNAANQQSGQYNDDAFVIRNHYATTGRRKIYVVDGWNRILTSVGSSYSERNKRSNLQMLANITSHN